MPEAVWFGGPQRVEIRQEPAAPVGPDDVRVRSLVSGVSAGSELLVYRGNAPRDLQPDLPTVGGDFGFPIKFAYASVGRVIEVGSRVDPAGGGRPRLRAPPASDRVRRAGRRSDPAARRPPSRRRGVRREPRDGGHGGARCPPSARRSGPRAGQGVVGLLITMLLRRAGATPIVTADLHERRRAASAAAGADHALGADVDLVDAVLELTDGRGWMSRSRSAGARPRSRPASTRRRSPGPSSSRRGTGPREVSLSLGGRFHRRRLRVVSSQVSTLDPALTPRWDRARRTALVSALLKELPLNELITHRFPLNQAATAYELLDHARGECLQVVLDYV